MQLDIKAGKPQKGDLVLKASRPRRREGTLPSTEDPPPPRATVHRTSAATRRGPIPRVTQETFLLRPFSL